MCFTNLTIINIGDDNTSNNNIKPSTDKSMTLSVVHNFIHLSFILLNISHHSIALLSLYTVLLLSFLNCATGNNTARAASLIFIRKN